MSIRRLLPLLSVLALLGGCDETMPPNGDSGPAEDGSAPLTAPTYYGDIRPILAANCQMCHTSEGVGPFPLMTYQEAFEVGDRMAEVTRDRIMPPFLADASGDCQTFSNDRTLSDEEIAVIGRWVQTGMIEGDPSTPAPERPEVLRLPRTDLTLEMSQPYDVDTTEDDDYRCFVVESTTTDPIFVTGYEVMPGNTQRVHHVIVYNPTSDAEAQRARDLDAAEGGTGTGYACFGGPRVEAPPLVLWAPGTNATAFPRGTGIELEAGRAQILQIHYNNLVDDAPADDQTRINLMTSATANQAYLVPFVNGGIVLPPGQERVTQSNTELLSMLPVPARAWGMFPHMHTLGRELRVDLSGTTDACLIDIPRWDFNWQLAYWYDEPVRVTPSDSVTISCTFNTMDRTETVRWGDGTQDEMCLSFVYLTL